MLIRESIKARCRTFRISYTCKSGFHQLSKCAVKALTTHILKIEPVIYINDVRKCATLRNAINAIACRAPDAILYHVWCVITAHRLPCVVQEIISTLQNAWDWVLVIEDDAGEVAIHSVVEVQHV